VRAVLKAGPPPPTINGVERHPVTSRQHRSRFPAGRDPCPDRRSRRRPRHCPRTNGGQWLDCAEITSSRCLPRCTGLQPRDQLAQRCPRDEQWQTTFVNANVRDGTVCECHSFGRGAARVSLLAARREAVSHLVTETGLSERRACRGLERRCLTRENRRSAPTMPLRATASRHGRISAAAQVAGACMACRTGGPRGQS